MVLVGQVAAFVRPVVDNLDILELVDIVPAVALADNLVDDIHVVDIDRLPVVHHMVDQVQVVEDMIAKLVIDNHLELDWMKYWVVLVAVVVVAAVAVVVVVVLIVAAVKLDLVVVHNLFDLLWLVVMHMVDLVDHHHQHHLLLLDHHYLVDTVDYFALVYLDERQLQLDYQLHFADGDGVC